MLFFHNYFKLTLELLLVGGGAGALLFVGFAEIEI